MSRCLKAHNRVKRRYLSGEEFDKLHRAFQNVKSCREIRFVRRGRLYAPLKGFASLDANDQFKMFIKGFRQRHVCAILHPNGHDCFLVAADTSSFMVTKAWLKPNPEIFSRFGDAAGGARLVRKLSLEDGCHLSLTFRPPPDSNSSSVFAAAPGVELGCFGGFSRADSGSIGRLSRL